MAFAVLLGLSVLSVCAAYVLAPRWGRSRSAWVWASLIAGPCAIAVLALMPKKTSEVA
jgi:hypothetical protein